ncbi:MAG TPA: hypothetical protein VMY76_14575 [Gemmatimonadales bacterium]|nr:hypothetical protein [Gemmatimonadales bacterium]
MSHDPASPTASPEKKALIEAFDSVLKTKEDERQAAQAAAEASRRARGASRLLMGLCATIVMFVAVYLYVERPEWVFPAPPQLESLAVREASLRITVANAAQHVERYRKQSGQLPATLQLAGAHGEGLGYDRTPGGYQITADAGEVRVVYRSTEPLARFVGNSFKVISRRGQ